jgi:hypothetical protein
VRISTQNILTFDGFASPLEVKPGGQGLDLLETRGWADRASGVIES